MDHRAQIKLAQDFAERERGAIDIRFVESAEGVEICAFYKGAGGQAMTASQMVLGRRWISSPNYSARWAKSLTACVATFSGGSRPVARMRAPGGVEVR